MIWNVSSKFINVYIYHFNLRFLARVALGACFWDFTVQVISLNNYDFLYYILQYSSYFFTVENNARYADSLPGWMSSNFKWSKHCWVHLCKGLNNHSMLTTVSPMCACQSFILLMAARWRFACFCICRCPHKGVIPPVTLLFGSSPCIGVDGNMDNWLLDNNLPDIPRC